MKLTKVLMMKKIMMNLKNNLLKVKKSILITMNPMNKFVKS